ncbi:tail fiber protein, partial [Paenibacillus kobensis]|uniref:tail fiber protein n=1 Tax=Paenibacillus kobensis TaxID=59841 RepID=UPI0013E35512
MQGNGNGKRLTKLIMALLIGLLIAGGGWVPIPKAKASADMPIVGEVKIFPYQHPPMGWLHADGRLLSIGDYQALFLAIGNRFGGDGVNTFALPDLRSKEVVSGTGYYISTEGIVPYPGMTLPLSNEVAVSELKIFAFDYTGAGLLPTQHQRLSINSYQALYSLISSSYGGDSTTFNLPDLSPLAPGVSYYISYSGVFPSGGYGVLPYVGEILTFPNAVNAGVIGVDQADGGLISISQNTALYALIGNRFGGDGRTNFAEPNFNADPTLLYGIAKSGVFPSLNWYEAYANPDSYSVTMNQTLTVTGGGVLANDSNVSSSILVAGPQHGTLSLNADGSFTYTPVANYSGSDSFMYKVPEGSIATVTISVLPPVIYRTVSFVSDGGSAVNSQTVAQGAMASKPTDPTRTGYTFGGWYSDAALSIPFNFMGTAITGDTTLYARWTLNQYIVSFNTDGGSVIGSQSVSYNGKVSKPVTDPTKTGYTFAGWYTSSGLTVPFDFTGTSITGDTTVYAKWTVNPYTVDFDTDGGTAEANQTVNYYAKA